MINDRNNEKMMSEAVRPYREELKKHRAALIVKRIFDILAALALIILLTPVMMIIAAAVAIDSPGGVFYRQTRVTAFCREFRIIKFRTMRADADRCGPAVTSGCDGRITRVGRILRGCRLDELPQLFNVLAGDMSFVGTRPEVPKFVARYTPEMYATLLLPAGITSEASIRFKDEAELIAGSDDPETEYVNVILPMKMKYNLASVKNFSLIGEAKTLVRTVLAVMGKDYSGSADTATRKNSGKVRDR